jgi:hypothetical protein
MKTMEQRTGISGVGIVAILLVFSSAHASTEIEDAISPNKKWLLTMKAAESRDDDLVRRYKVFLKNRALLTTETEAR